MSYNETNFYGLTTGAFGHDCYTAPAATKTQVVSLLVNNPTSNLIYVTVKVNVARTGTIVQIATNVILTTSSAMEILARPLILEAGDSIEIDSGSTVSYFGSVIEKS